MKKRGELRRTGLYRGAIGGGIFSPSIAFPKLSSWACLRSIRKEKRCLRVGHIGELGVVFQGGSVVLMSA